MCVQYFKGTCLMSLLLAIRYDTRHHDEHLMHKTAPSVVLFLFHWREIFKNRSKPGVKRLALQLMSYEYVMWFSVSGEESGVTEIIHNGECRGERRGSILGVVFCRISHFALNFSLSQNRAYYLPHIFANNGYHSKGLSQVWNQKCI